MDAHAITPDAFLMWAESTGQPLGMYSFSASLFFFSELLDIIVKRNGGSFSKVHG